MILSDAISQKIIEMIDKAEGKPVQIHRNTFARELGCVPSHINYVLNSRFTPEQGYIIKSQRGGGGYVVIRRINLDRTSALMHIVNSVGQSLDQMTARILIENSLQTGLITAAAAELMMAAVSTRVLEAVPQKNRGEYRAAVIKQLFISQL